MAERYTSLLALRLEEQPDVGAIVRRALDAGDIDRAGSRSRDPAEAQEVYWGGRMQKGVVRGLTDGAGRQLLRTEVDISGDGLQVGMQRQARLVRVLARQIPEELPGVVDLSASVERDRDWLGRLAEGRVEVGDAVVVRSETAHGDEGPAWLHTHGAARLQVPDLELYGLETTRVEAGTRALRTVHRQLLEGGLEADLELPGGTPVYLVPVLEAWRRLPLEWPGVARAGEDRGAGLAGPRATLSVLHPPRLGHYRTDLEGVLAALPEDE